MIFAVNILRKPSCVCDFAVNIFLEPLVVCVIFAVNGVSWPQESGRRNSQTFNCRLLKRPPDEADSDNQEARQQYESMQCLTVSQPRSVLEEREGKKCLVWQEVEI